MARDFEHPLLNSLHLELMSTLCHCCASHRERYEEDNGEKYCIQTKKYVTIEGLRTPLFLVITQRVVVNYYRRFGTTYRSHPQGEFGFLNPDARTDRLSRNVGKKLPLLAA